MFDPIEVDTAAGLVTGTFRGQVDGEEIVRFMADCIAHKQWDPAHDILCDGSNVTAVAVAPADLTEIVRFLSENAKRFGYGRSAVVIRSDLHHGLMNLIARKQAQVSPRPMRVFERMEDARAWLALRPVSATGA